MSETPPNEIPRVGNWWKEKDWEWRTSGPMYGERTARHQKLVEGNTRAAQPTILTMYEHAADPQDPRLYVEIQVDDRGVDRIHLTPHEAREYAERLTAFADAWETRR